MKCLSFGTYLIFLFICSHLLNFSFTKEFKVFMCTIVNHILFIL